MLIRSARLIAAVVMTMTSSAVLAEPQPQQPKEPTISVNGTARVDRTPDYVDVSVGIVSEEKTASAAQAAASHTMEEAITAVRALKLPDQDLQTGTVELSPRYEQHRDYNEIPKVIGYSATLTIRVRTSDL